MFRRSIPRSYRLLLLFSIHIITISGCAKETDELVCFPTRGMVRYDNKPLAEALIVLHPLEQHPEDAGAPKPIATSGADGTFQLTTLKLEDGAPPGEYIITVELREQRMDGDQLVRDGKNLLPERYGKPGKSTLKYRVVEGDNEIPVLELSSK